MATIHIGQGGAPYDLMMLMGETDGQLVCRLAVQHGPLRSGDDRADGRAFEMLLGGIVVNPGDALSELPMLTEKERREQAAWNDTVSPTTPPTACTRW